MKDNDTQQLYETDEELLELLNTKKSIELDEELISKIKNLSFEDKFFVNQFVNNIGHFKKFHDLLKTKLKS